MTFDRLLRVAPPPHEYGGLLAFSVGSVALIDAAIGLLKIPAEPILAMRQECAALARECIARFEAAGHADAYDALADIKASRPAWAAVAAAGMMDDVHTHPAAAALGTELCWSLEHRKPMAERFASAARLSLTREDLQGVSLYSTLESDWDGAPPPWLPHARKAYVRFLARFELGDHDPPPVETFEQRAARELRMRAAFATYRRRAGLLDASCWSQHQLLACLAHPHLAQTSSVPATKAAMWFVAMSGLFPGSVAAIPTTACARNTWVMYYDADTGLLHRDYSGLAPDAAKARPGAFIPASYCVPTPAPQDVHSFLLDRAAMFPDHQTVGDLLPALRGIQSRAAIYPCPGDLQPSWARLARSLGPYALQTGIDSLLASMLTGDFGVSARSKLHYCLVDSSEVSAAATALYLSLGWGNPVSMPVASQLAFGVAVVTPVCELTRLDSRWVEGLEAMRPSNRLAGPARLLEFHNRYARLLGSRMCLWLSLRAATELPVRACIDTMVDLVVDLVEKASAGRVGGMPAAICPAMRRDVGSYLLHCEAMLARLRGMAWHGQAIEWLQAVLVGADVPLLCEISSATKVRPIGTAEILELPDAAWLPKDWARKAAENFLRRAGARWQDIDRHQRHEVKGQEQDTQLADGTEAEWARRLAPALETLSLAVHRAPLFGLRRTGGLI